jgi:hypothetical protein
MWPIFLSLAVFVPAAAAMMELHALVKSPHRPMEIRRRVRHRALAFLIVSGGALNVVIGHVVQ